MEADAKSYAGFLGNDCMNLNNDKKDSVEVLKQRIKHCVCKYCSHQITLSE